MLGHQGVELLCVRLQNAAPLQPAALLIEPMIVSSPSLNIEAPLLPLDVLVDFLLDKFH